jgi:hypothetical protein
MRWLPVVVLLVGVVVACGTRLNGTDTTTLQLQAENCNAAVNALGDAGPAFAQVRAIDRTCTCGSRGILARAGKPLPDAGKAGCPQ